MQMSLLGQSTKLQLTFILEMRKGFLRHQFMPRVKYRSTETLCNMFVSNFHLSLSDFDGGLVRGIKKQPPPPHPPSSKVQMYLNGYLAQI